MDLVKSYKQAMHDFFDKNGAKILLLIGLILVAAVSFESGYLKGKSVQNSPIIVEKPAVTPNFSQESTQGSVSEAQNLVSEAKIAVSTSAIPPQKCAFVGSKNSNKYHLPTCRYAKLIKPENVVCFSSVEDASAKNYLPDKICIK